MNAGNNNIVNFWGAIANKAQGSMAKQPQQTPPNNNFMLPLLTAIVVLVVFFMLVNN